MIDIRSVATTVLGLAAAIYVARQCRKPSGWVGRLLVWNMNKSHSGLTDWGLSHVPIDKSFTILDVGCGGGATLGKLAAAATEGKAYGVDYSPSCVAASRRTNEAAIASGRVEVHQGSVSHLPFGDGRFDLVTAVETHYYWPDLASDLREVLRVLKPGGRLMLLAEMYKHGPRDFVNPLIMKPLGGKVMSVEEHRALLAAAGCSEVEVHEEPRKGWICAIGRRPV